MTESRHAAPSRTRGSFPNTGPSEPSRLALAPSELELCETKVADHPAVDGQRWAVLTQAVGDDREWKRLEGHKIEFGSFVCAKRELAVGVVGREDHGDACRPAAMQGMSAGCADHE